MRRFGFTLPDVGSMVSSAGAAVKQAAAKAADHVTECGGELQEIAKLKQQRMVFAAGGLVAGLVVGYMVASKKA